MAKGRVSETLLRWKILFRLSIVKAMRFWLYLIRCKAGNLVKTINYNHPELSTVRQEILKRHQAIQESFRQVFAPYYGLCRDCRVPCCVVQIQYCTPGQPCQSPRSPVDALIFGDPPERVTHPFTLSRSSLKEILSHKEVAAFQTCPDLGQTGCNLSWGRRPDVCIFPLCKIFARHMTWGDYGRYLKVCVRYFLHLHRSLKQIGAGSRHLQAAPGSGSNVRKMEPQSPQP